MDNNLKLSLRAAELSDLPEIQKLFVETISAICKDDYSPEQIKVWISSIKNKQRWADKILSQYFIVAALDNNIVGFASLANSEYLDLLYVHKDYQRQGIADKLYSEIEKEAIQRKAKYLYSDVSKTARPFFEMKGFKTLQEQIHVRHGIEILNFNMAKQF